MNNRALSGVYSMNRRLSAAFGPSGLALVLLVSFSVLPVQAQVTLSRIFGDGMVMQRDIRVPVWGWAGPGATITVTFDGKNHSANANDKGEWKVELPAMSAGGPHEMTVSGDGATIHVKDILAGDVWICSGQSNMEWTVDNVNNAKAEIAAAGDDRIRHFKVPTSWAERPENDLAGGSWSKADPAHVGQFTAVGYFFAREIRKKVDVPIGLLNTSWGGSRIEPWMSAAALKMDENSLNALYQREREREATAAEAIRARIGGLPEKDGGLVDGKAVWADPSLDDKTWSTIRVPGAWEGDGYEGMDGIAWYRTEFELTEADIQSGVRLGLGQIDDSDITWVNGTEVGRMEAAWNKPRLYAVPASALKAGRNVVAVRVEDTGGGGGIAGASDQLFLEVRGARKPFPAPWKFMVGKVTVNAGGQKNQIATLLYNKMIYPILSFPIKGALWYQGESNAGLEEAYQYRTLFADMITSWRKNWNVGEFPFLFVQLANFMATDSVPSESGWALLRESQSATLSVPNTAQAVIIDIGEANDIHPRNKQDVGYRLSLAARKLAYGEDIEFSGPVYRAHKVEGNRFLIDFDHAGSGLVVKGTSGNLNQFAIAGEDRKFVWAKARIEGNRVVVWSDSVPHPVAVRYAWGNNPEGANLYNKEDLPASPFRTDTW